MTLTEWLGSKYGFMTDFGAFGSEEQLLLFLNINIKIARQSQKEDSKA